MDVSHSQWGLDPTFWVPYQLMICQVHDLIRVHGYSEMFAHHSHPVQMVTIVGLITAVDRKHNGIHYEFQDGTGKISCIHWIPDEFLTVQNIATVGIKVYELGNTVRITGTVGVYMNNRQLSVLDNQIELCTDPNEETLHRLRVLTLERDVYLKPFIPGDLSKISATEKIEPRIADAFKIHLKVWIADHPYRHWEFTSRQAAEDKNNMLQATRIAAQLRPESDADGLQLLANSIVVESLESLVREGKVELVDAAAGKYRVK